MSARSSRFSDQPPPAADSKQIGKTVFWLRDDDANTSNLPKQGTVVGCSSAGYAIEWAEGTAHGLSIEEISYGPPTVEKMAQGPTQRRRPSGGGGPSDGWEKSASDSDDSGSDVLGAAGGSRVEKRKSAWDLPSEDSAKKRNKRGNRKSKSRGRSGARATPDEDDDYESEGETPKSTGPGAQYWYGIQAGAQSAVVYGWGEAGPKSQNIPGARVKKFLTAEEAEAYVRKDKRSCNFRHRG